MPVIAKRTCTIYPTTISISQLSANQFSLGIYGDAASEIDDLLPSVRDHGILVPLVVSPVPAGFEVISGHRRLACARLLDFNEVPCQVRELNDSDAVRQAILHYNRQRCKTFSQSMREADAIEELWTAEANTRRVRNLRSVHRIKRALTITDRRNSDTLPLSEEILGPVPDQDQKQGSKVGRSDSALGRLLNLGGKDLYRQARTIWRLALAGDVRAQSGVKQLDSKTKTIHAVHKDLRRRDRFTVNFRPTPYDVWAFRHDRAFGIPHPGAIPPGIIAHTLYYFTPPDGLVVDPMAGGGTTIDVCEAMGRR
jgi:ParB family chromosome partitioning protein